MTNMNGNMKRTFSAAHLAVLTVGLISMSISFAGCGTGLSTSTSATNGPIAAARGGLKGNVHGGQQPITGATIQLYAVGSSGLGSAASPLIPVGDQVVYNPLAAAGTTGALTDSSGNFNITGDYTCPTPSPQVYLVAVGGNAGGTGPNNSIALMSALGDCATLVSNSANTYVFINEVTTVAAVYALAPFMTGYSNVGAATVNSPGLMNAVGSFNVLVNSQTGLVGGPSAPAGTVLPSTEIYTLADILASCVNSTSSGSSACQALFSATGSSDTIGATLGIAKNPSAAAITALTTYATATSPFQPTYASNPSDYTIAIKYNANGALSAPYGIAIDATGNAWVTNSTSNKVTELGPTGVVGLVLTGGGLIGPKGISIDRGGNIWIANPASNSVVEFNTSGTLESGTGFTVGGLAGPVAIANDSAGNAWVANLTGNSVTELSSSGAASKTSLTAGGSISLPTGIALDTSGNVYVANNGSGSVVKLSNSTGAAIGSPLTDVALQGASAVAVDTSGDIFAAGSTTGATVAGATSQFTSAGVASTYSPVTGGGLSLPSGIATSGTTAYVTNAAGSLSKLTYGAAAPVSPAAGYGAANSVLGITGLSAPIGVAIDGSGNVWTANSGDNTVSVFVGLAVPVTTPIAANVGP